MNELIKCVGVNLNLCGEALEKVEKAQKEYEYKTGQKMSKKRAIIKLILESK